MNPLPESLLKSISSACAIDGKDLDDAHQKSASISVRINPFKKTDVFELEDKVKWATDAYYLKERMEFIKDPLFHAGCYYVQEASSMFLEQSLKQTLDLNRDIKILDLCASPGGKSTLINSLIGSESILIANEVIKTRVPTLCENLAKWGCSNHLVTNNDPSDFGFLSEYFDAIVVDAPCSGSGLFRKQEDALLNWNEESVKHCASRQKRILNDILGSLKPGGILIYSTCSFSTEENEAIGDYLLLEKELEPIKLNLHPEWQITETSTSEGTFGYRFFPHLTRGEGFFLAAFRKQEKEDHSSRAYGRKKKGAQLEKITVAEHETLSKYVNINNNTQLLKLNGRFFALNSSLINDLSLLSKLYVRKKGTLLGEFKGKDFIPDHELALSNQLHAAINALDLSLEKTLHYLKKGDLIPLENGVKGFCVVKYNGHALGWVKNLGNRINNYLPKEWRILKSIEEL